MASQPFPLPDIIYTSFLLPLSLLALLEWVLWLLAFLFCLAKVFAKAESWSVRFLAVGNMVLFTVLRLVFLPVMLVTLPLPGVVGGWLGGGLGEEEGKGDGGWRGGLQWVSSYLFFFGVEVIDC